jgi:hypothetical protein
VYCRTPDAILGYAQFGTDHYRPKSIFPKLIVTYSNLFYCCNACNRNKGNYWPRDDEASRNFIPNPVVHSMFSHLRYKNALVESASPAGTFTVECLDLNDPAAVQWREDLIHIIDVLEDKLKEVAKAEIAVKAALDDGRITEDTYQEKLGRIHEYSAKTQRALDRSSGRYLEQA